MLLKPGRRVRVRHQQSGNTFEASVARAGGKELVLHQSPGLELYPGDEIELELRRWGNALCVLQGIVIEISDSKVHIIQEQAGLRQPQRRKSERIQANIWVEYLLLPKKEFDTYREGMIRDISMHGALLEANEPLDLNNRISLVFELFFNGKKASTTGVSGRVVRKHRGPGKGEHSYGVEFENPLTLPV